MELKSIKDISIKGKKVLIRCDFNVPLDEFGNINDDRRITESLNTIKYCLENDCKVIIVSHMGRPKGDGFEKALSLEPVAKRLHGLLRENVVLANDIGGDDTKEKLSNLKSGEVLLLENVRFDAREQKDDESFAKELASLADVYINDAFGVSHRAHSSVHAIVKYFDEGSYGSGFLIQKEIKFFGKVMNNPVRPFAAIVGGSKVSGKLEAIFSLIPKIDKLFIGGGMAFTFLKAQGYDIGNSLVELDLLDDALKVIEEAKKAGVKLYFPVDYIVADEFDGQAHKKDVTYQEMPDGYMGLDIGRASVELFKIALNDCKTVLWNGPMGVFEMPQFAQGSLNISHFLGKLEEATTIVGGGDTANVALMAGDIESFTFISTGGGASLEIIEGKELPGVEKLVKGNK